MTGILPEGQRKDDPPEQGFWFRVKLAVAKSPVMAGVTIALIVATVALYLVLQSQSALHQAQEDLRKSKVSNATLKISSKRFCQRLQIERDRANKLGAIIYLTLDLSADREATLADQGPNSGAHRRSANGLHALAQEAEWTPPTNCREATKHPRQYDNPESMDFTRPIAAEFIPRAAKVLLEQRGK